jgi:hypothetical protein
MEVKTVKTAQGVRVDFLFPDGTLPEYHIRPMNNYLLVFFGERSLEMSQAEQPETRLVRAEDSRPLPRPRLDAGTQAGRVQIKDCEVRDGAIRLTVENAARPGALYAVELKVDFETPGFTSAHIRPLNPQAVAPLKPNGTPAPGREASRSPRPLVVDPGPPRSDFAFPAGAGARR